MTESVPTQTPLVGLQMDPDTALYVGLLEGTLSALVLNEMKYRALLELYTGESFEATKIGIDGKTLIDLAVSTLVKQTGMDLGKAKVLVLQRWNARNQETPVIPQAVAPEQLALLDPNATAATTATAGSKPDRTMSERFASWKARQLASAAAIPDEAPAKVEVTAPSDA